MAVKEENLVFTTLDDEKIEFEIIEQTTINGDNYLLVCDADDTEESEAFILKEIKKNDNDVFYDDVVDDVLSCETY